MLVSEREMVSKITRRGSYLKFLNTSCQNKAVRKKEETNHTGAFMTAAPETPHLAQTVIFAYNGTVYSSNFADSDFFVLVYAAKERWEDQTDHTRYLCLHSGLQHRTDDPKKIYRYADFCVHPDLLVAILRRPYSRHAANKLCATLFALSTPQQRLVTALVCSTPSGDKLAWQFWEHPDMPWEGAQLYAADVHYNSNT
jgi:hypothetical protein